VKRTCSFLLLPLLLLASGSPGIRPRSGVNDYPGHARNADVEGGAAIIPPGEAKKIFAADLGQYIVIEVGLFPIAGRDADISPLDFTLLTDPDTVSLRPVDADSVAAVVLKDSGSSPRNPQDVYTTTGISVVHESYPDPVTGRRTGITGVGTSAGVGVGVPVGPQYPPPGSGANRAHLEQSLWEKSLPDGKTPRPVAGYLYFPKPTKKVKNAAYVLRWDGPAGRVNIALR
jgi:hypothetical protein